LPEIEDATRVSLYSGYLAFSAGEKKFNENEVIFADPGFFSLFSFPLTKGNREECFSSPNSVVLSENATKKYFGDEDPIGKQLRIGNNKNFTVTGIFQNFKSNSNFRGDVVLPLKKISKLTQVWIEPSWKYESDIHTFVLLSDQTNMDELSEKAKSFITNYKSDSNHELSFQRLKDIHIEKQFFWESVAQANVKYLYILITVAFIILCISSANFLFLYIGTESQHAVNTGIKKVCGASKPVLFLEHFREVILKLMFSVAIATVLFLVYNFALTHNFPFLPHIALFDYQLGIILSSVILGVAILSGIYPSIILSSQRPVHIFSTNKNVSHSRIKLINLLVIGQFALCVGLIGTIFLMQKQTNFLESQDTGYAKDELITIPLNRHIGDGIYNEKFDVFAEELKKIPGVKNVSLSYSSPSSVGTTGDNIPDWEGRPEGKRVYMHWASVSYDYFETLGVNIVEGRDFSRNYSEDKLNWDTRKCAFVLNQKAVKEMGIDDPIGKEFEIWSFKGPIIGVVENYNFKSLHSEITPLFFQINPLFLNEIIVRAGTDIPTVLPDIKNVWDKFVSDYPVEFSFVSDEITKLYKPERNLANSLSLFSIIAIAIACVGLFTLTILSINQRIKEIGIRKVNGAKVFEILAMLNKDFIKWVAIAFVIAVPVSYFAMNTWLETFAYKTELSWWIFAIAGVMALGIALLTVSWQTYKAANRNPVDSIRYE
jgi:putative ABC transport system permease protein